MRPLPLLGVLVAACTSKEPDPDSETDVDTDTDSDADTDSDTDADSDSDTDADADADSDADAVDPLTYDDSAVEDDFQGVRFGWIDSDHRLRTALMIRNDTSDPWGHHGGYLRTFSYVLETGDTRTCTGSNYTHPGFGETVNHWSDTATVSHMAGTWDVPFVGRHHARVVYRWDLPISGETVHATVVWTFATGLDHPVYAVTFDSSDAAEGDVEADTRTPYGDLDWDGGAGSDVDGVGWGDHYRFTSTDSPVDLTSGWDYTVPNEIPYVLEWAVAADAEMGTVQTQTMEQHDAGGYWFYDAWGTADADGPMPEDWNWTYQLNQYEMPFTLKSKRVAWGSNYGAVGRSDYDAYGYLGTLSGWPYQSYAVYVVLDEHSDDPVLTRVEQMEQVQSVAIAASVGEVLDEVPAGVDRSDTSSSEPSGWDPSVGAFHLVAEGGSVAFSVGFSSGAVENPMFLIDGWTGGDPVVTLDSATATADADYYASVDEDEDQLWLTIAGNVGSTVIVTVE